MILVVGGIKGGCGKTTLATNLAVCRSMISKKVLLIDADQQGTATDWGAQRLPNSFLENSLSSIDVLRDSGENLYKRLERYMHFYDDIIVDTGGRDTTSQRSAMVKCDAFLTPLRPKSFDLWTLTSLRSLNSDLKTINPNFRVMAVLNQCSPRNKDKINARIYIQENNIECLKTEIGYRKSFSDASSLGLGIIEFDKADKKSVDEMLSLHDDIYMGNMLNIFSRNKKNI